MLTLFAPAEHRTECPDEGGAPSAPKASDRPLIVLFDGVCNLCNWTVRFVMDRDPEGRFLFAPLQSRRAEELLRPHPIDSSALDAIVLIDGDHCFDQSDAALRIARHLRGPWSLLYLFLGLPRSLRDMIYRYVARNRYRWFGHEDHCRLPTEAERARFLNDAEDHTVR